MSINNTENVNLEALRSVMNGFCDAMMNDVQLATKLHDALDHHEAHIATFIQEILSRALDQSLESTAPVVCKARQFIVNQLSQHEPDLSKWSNDLATVAEHFVDPTMLPSWYDNCFLTLVVIDAVREAVNNYGYVATKTALEDLDKQAFNLAQANLNT